MKITVAELIERLGNFNDDATLALLNHFNGEGECVLTEVVIRDNDVDYTVHVFGKYAEDE